MHKKLIIILTILFIPISCKTRYRPQIKHVHNAVMYNLDYKRKSLLKSDTSAYNYKIILANKCNYLIENVNIYAFFVDDSLYTFYKRTHNYTIRKRNKYSLFVIPICAPYKEMFRDSTIVNINNDTIRIRKVNRTKNSFEASYFIKNNRIENIEKTIKYLGHTQYEKFYFSNFKETVFNLKNELNIKLQDYKLYVVSKDTQQVIEPFFFSGKYLNGKSFNSKKYSNDNVVYFFWHQRCFPCILSLPKMNAMYKKYKDRINIIGVNMSDKKQIIEGVIKQNKVIFSNIIADSIFMQRRIKAFPFFVVIKNKKVIYESAGYSNDQFVKLDSIIQKLVVEKEINE